jgi:hypothetical protein
MSDSKRPSRTDTVKVSRAEIHRLLREGGDLIRCPACAAAGWTGVCGCCLEQRFVSREKFIAFYDRHEGRPSDVPLDSYERR